jgi:antitoxin VapB
MLNIKNKETYKLAKELSKVTGLSMTVAVTEAVREKLESEKTKNYKKSAIKLPRNY